MQASDHRATLVVTPWFPPTIGGVARVSERLRVGLQERGIPVHVVVADGTHPPSDSEGRSNVHPMDVPGAFWPHPGPRNLASLAMRAPATWFRLRRFVHHHDIRNILLLYPIDFAWPFVLLARSRKLRLIVSLHGNDVMLHDQYAAPLRWLQRMTLRQADRILTCAPHLDEIAARIAPGRSDRIRMIPNCVDTEHFFPDPERTAGEPLQGAGRSGPTFLHVSNFAPKKRTLDIIRSFHSADLPEGSRLLMVGEGPQLREAVRCVEDFSLTDRVHFSGHVSDVRPFYRQADIFVMASDAEGAPLAILEAMASGLPWISTPWGAAADLESGRCGIAFACGDFASLTRAMQLLAADPDRTNELGREARRLAEERYSVEAYLEQHMQVLT